jgi:acetyl esterase/lipase
MSLLRKITLAGVSICLMLAGCSPALLNPFTPSEGYSVTRDVAYGSEPQQRLDIYVPDKGGSAAPAPVLIFYYGGSWRIGDKDQYHWVGQTFASRGIVTVLPNYSLYPPALYPSFVNDAAKAAVFVHENIAHYGGDPNRMFVMGHSAGAYNAIMLAANPAFMKDAHGDIGWIHGAIGISGPYDFLPLKDPNLIAIFGGPNHPEMLPITYVTGKRPPMLLVTGTDDETVSPGNTKRMADRLRANGSAVREIYYPGLGHDGAILSFAPVIGPKTTLTGDVAAFIAAH